MKTLPRIVTTPSFRISFSTPTKNEPLNPRFMARLWVWGSSWHHSMCWDASGHLQCPTRYLGSHSRLVRRYLQVYVFLFWYLARWGMLRCKTFLSWWWPSRLMVYDSPTPSGSQGESKWVDRLSCLFRCHHNVILRFPSIHRSSMLRKHPFYRFRCSAAELKATWWRALLSSRYCLCSYFPNLSVHRAHTDGTHVFVNSIVRNFKDRYEMLWSSVRSLYLSVWSGKFGCLGVLITMMRRETPSIDIHGGFFWSYQLVFIFDIFLSSFLGLSLLNLNNVYKAQRLPIWLYSIDTVSNQCALNMAGCYPEANWSQCTRTENIRSMRFACCQDFWHWMFGSIGFRVLRSANGFTEIL
jgi:hypothetical protein